MSAERAPRWDSPALAQAIAPLLGASQVAIERCERMAGGAIQQNLLLDIRISDGPWAAMRQMVLRTSAPSSVAASRPRHEEYALLVAGHAAGVATPQPIAMHRGDDEWPAFMLMSYVQGEASGRRLTRAVTEPRAALAAAIGANLARVHAVPAAQASLAFLGGPPSAPTAALLDAYTASLAQWSAQTGDTRPVLLWALRWLALRAPREETVTLVHRDYRVGNLLIDGGNLAATLDWEFAGYGNPLEDLGWFCAPCWRFARPDLDAGGLAPAADFLNGYNAVAGTAHTPADLRYWQVLAQLRWSVIALQQALRFLRHGERSLELALTGRLLPALEWQTLQLTGDTLG